MSGKPTTAKDRLKAELIRREKAKQTEAKHREMYKEYNAEIQVIVDGLTANKPPPKMTTTLRDVTGNEPGKYCLRINNEAKIIAKFRLFRNGSLAFGHFESSPTSNLPIPILLAPCEFVSNAAIIFDISAEILLTLTQSGNDIVISIIPFDRIVGIRNLFAHKNVKLAAIKLLKTEEFIMCFTTPHAHCEECETFNVFSLSLSVLKSGGPEFIPTHCVKNGLVGKNVITSICDLGYISNVWSKIGCNHFPKDVNWGYLSCGKFIDSYGGFVILESEKLSGSPNPKSGDDLQIVGAYDAMSTDRLEQSDTLRCFEFYRQGVPIFTYEGHQTCFNERGFILIRKNNVVTLAGITKDLQLMILIEYVNCKRIMRYGPRLMIVPTEGSKELEYDNHASTKNMMAYKDIAYAF
jgi:hypothetical protein